jgi:hypothetical protein
MIEIYLAMVFGMVLGVWGSWMVWTEREIGKIMRERYRIRQAAEAEETEWRVW